MAQTEAHRVRAGHSVSRRPQWRLLIGAALVAARLAGQSAGTGAQLSGTVKNSVTGLPVPKAVVRLLPDSANVGYVRTSGALGEFSFEQIPAGDYRVHVERRGFSPSVHASSKGVPTGSRLHLAAGQKTSDLDVLITPFPVITGTVTLADDDPVPHAVIYVLAQRWSETGRWYAEVDSTDTNERGEFRIAGLEPGHYFLYARGPENGPLASIIKSPAGTGEVRLQALYYPHAASVESAAPIEVRGGQELSGVDFRLSWAPCFHVRGHAAAHLEEIQLVRQSRSGSLPWESRSATRAKDGSFDFSGVTPGEYLAKPLVDDIPKGAGILVAVDSRDLSGLEIAGENPIFQIRVRMEGENAPPLSVVTLQLSPEEASQQPRRFTIPVLADGSIHPVAVPAARYVLRLLSREGDLYIKSLRSGAQEIQASLLDLRFAVPADLELVVAVGAGRVQGTVQWPDPSQAGTPVAGTDTVQAVLAPQEARPGVRSAWLSDLDAGSSFTFSGIPPGKYWTFVAVNPDEGMWGNREFVRLMASSGVAVELAEKATVQVQVPVVSPLAVQRAVESIR